MPISLRHKFVSPKQDTSDPTIVQASNWNDEHDLLVEARTILGRDASDAGQVDELSTARTRNLLDLPHYEALDRVLASATDVVDVFIYNTMRDSDGGAWTDRCQHTSWYNEELNTATRGAKREFPKVAGIVARASSLTIFDLNDLDGVGNPRMWMVFETGGTFVAEDWNILGISSVSLGNISALNGNILIANTTNNWGATRIVFQTERSDTAWNSSGRRRYRGNIAQRNSGLGGALETDIQLVSATATHVHTRVLPGALLDSFGLPVPTIAIAMTNGISVVHPNGSVADITGQSYASVYFEDDFRLFAGRSASSAIDFGRIPYSDVVNTAWRENFYSDSAEQSAGLVILNSATSQAISKAAFGASTGLSLRQTDYSAASSGMVGYVTTSYATGWLSGDVRLAILGDGTTGDVTGGSLPDRSSNGNDFAVNGTLSRSPVAPDSDLVAVSGFVAGTNFLSQAYTPDLDVGTGDLAVVVWIRTSGLSGTVFHRQDPALAGNRIMMDIDAGNIRFAIQSLVISTTPVNSDSWRQIVGLRRNGVIEIWVDGNLVATGANTVDATNTDAVTHIGQRVGDLLAFTGSISLLRFSAYAPSPDQIRKIYEEERPLFQDGAKAFLGGTSNAVSALSYDEGDDILAVATEDGVSTFSGLRRVGYYADANTTLTSDTIRAVSVSNGVRLIASDAEAIIHADTRDPTTEINRNDALINKEDRLLRPLPYEDRGTLRRTEGFADYKAFVEGLGLFHFVPGSPEPDDDETCFRSQTGAWLMEAAAPDYVHALWLPEIEDIEGRLASVESRTATAQAKILNGVAISTATTVGSLAQHVFTTEIMGAVVGDRVLATPPHTLHPRLSFGAYVSATNTITIFINNPSAAATGITTGNAGDGTWAITVFKE